MTVGDMTTNGVVSAESLASSGLARQWTFEGNAGLRLFVRRTWRRRWQRRTAPASLELVPLTAREEWFVYFIFLPDGQLTLHHRTTLSRLRDMGYAVLVVCAAARPSSVPDELKGWADAIYWKALSGYDFSAYALALHEIARASPGATVCVINDSVYGPLTDLRPFTRIQTWDLSGFTASSLFANHLQSYAFVMRDISTARLAPMQEVFPLRHAFDRAGDVILCQELHFADVASRHMRVGAHWYGLPGRVNDPTLERPFELLGDGFPFVKKSLLGKQSRFQRVEEVRSALKALGYPLAD